jgi:hypothetical protein
MQTICSIPQEKSTGPAVAEDKPELVDVFNLHMKRGYKVLLAEADARIRGRWEEV